MQNLNVDLDLTILFAAIRSGKVKAHEWKDKNGEVHNTITLFVKTTQQPSEKKTHNVTVKQQDTWNEVVGDDGKKIYFGSAKPSRFQPDAPSVQSQAQIDTSDIKY